MRITSCMGKFIPKISCSSTATLSSETGLSTCPITPSTRNLKSRTAPKLTTTLLSDKYWPSSPLSRSPLNPSSPKMSTPLLKLLLMSIARGLYLLCLYCSRIRLNFLGKCCRCSEAIMLHFLTILSSIPFMLKSRQTRPVKSSSHSLLKRLSTSCPHPKNHKIS